MALGLGMTVAELKVRMSGEELAHWAAYERLDPFGDTRADIRSGIVASILANAHRGKDQKPFKVKDFMFFLPRQGEVDDEEDELP